MAFSPVFPAPFSKTFSTASAKTRYTLTLQPGAVAGIDTWVSSAAPDTNYGTEIFIQIRKTSGVGLIKFDLTSIPAGATIISSTLTLTASGTEPSGVGTCTISRILAANAAWTETGATYNHLDGVSDWAGGHSGCNTIGTDYSSTSMGSFSYGSSDPAGTQYVVVLGLVEFGLMLANNCGINAILGASQNFKVATSDHAAAGYWPKLVVVYDA